MCLLVSHTIFYLSVYSDSVRHLRELSFLPYGHPKTGTVTILSSPGDTCSR